MVSDDAKYLRARTNPAAPAKSKKCSCGHQAAKLSSLPGASLHAVRRTAGESMTPSLSFAASEHYSSPKISACEPILQPIISPVGACCVNRYCAGLGSKNTRVLAPPSFSDTKMVLCKPIRPAIRVRRPYRGLPTRTLAVRACPGCGLRGATPDACCGWFRPRGKRWPRSLRVSSST